LPQATARRIAEKKQVPGGARRSAAATHRREAGRAAFRPSARAALILRHAINLQKNKCNEIQAL